MHASCDSIHEPHLPHTKPTTTLRAGERHLKSMVSPILAVVVVVPIDGIQEAQKYWSSSNHDALVTL